MSFPVYFALNWKESVNDPKIFPAQYGFGFTQSGALRLPERVLPNALRIIDDAILPKSVPDAAAMKQLAGLCGKGCLFDFERTPTQMHAAILLSLSPMLKHIPLLAAPKGYLALEPSLLPLLSPPPRCSNWRSFVVQAGASFPRGWMLEIIPCSYEVEMPFPAQSSGVLADALCCYRQKGKTTFYYDTQKTLEKKLYLAGENGCRAAIGLYQELQKLQ